MLRVASQAKPSKKSDDERVSKANVERVATLFYFEHLNLFP